MAMSTRTFFDLSYIAYVRNASILDEVKTMIAKMRFQGLLRVIRVSDVLVVPATQSRDLKQRAPSMLALYT